MTPHHDMYGLVLAGGKSTRMGTDKGSLDYHGMPQREFLFNILNKFCHKVFTSCYAGQNIPKELNPLEDQYEIKGPMNGILSALKQDPDKAWIIVAVDMPCVVDKVFEQLISNRNKKKVATCFYNESEKFPEPLLTIWEPTALPLLLAFVEEGRTSPRDFLTSNSVQLIIPEDPKILLGINHRDEYYKFGQPD